MKYQKIIHLLDSTPNQLIKFRTKNWVAINNDTSETCNTNIQIKPKTSMLVSSLWDFSDAYTLASGNITITREWVDDAGTRGDEREKRSDI